MAIGTYISIITLNVNGLKMIHGYVCNDEKLEKIVHQIVKMRPLQSGLQWA